MKKKGTNMKPNTVVPLRWFVMLCAIWYHFTFLKTWNTPMEECHLWTHEHLDTHGHFLNCLNGLNWNIFFFNSASVLFNFLVNWASNAASELLNTYEHHHTETRLILTIFAPMSGTRSIYVVLWSIILFHLHFHYD